MEVVEELGHAALKARIKHVQRLVVALRVRVVPVLRHRHVQALSVYTTQ